mmetsp:Transcript_57686/g.167445  ORF Transcript_57686/g.167445 Transcript_57686/m.167445 type:complete len:293 (-) Transcript_57686:950-1828(-)
MGTVDGRGRADARRRRRVRRGARAHCGAHHHAADRPEVHHRGQHGRGRPGAHRRAEHNAADRRHQNRARGELRRVRSPGLPDDHTADGALRHQSPAAHRTVRLLQADRGQPCLRGLFRRRDHRERRRHGRAGRLQCAKHDREPRFDTEFNDFVLHHPLHHRARLQLALRGPRVLHALRTQGLEHARSCLGPFIGARVGHACLDNRRQRSRWLELRTAPLAAHSADHAAHQNCAHHQDRALHPCLAHFGTPDHVHAEVVSVGPSAPGDTDVRLQHHLHAGCDVLVDRCAQGDV